MDFRLFVFCLRRKSGVLISSFDDVIPVTSHEARWFDRGLKTIVRSYMYICHVRGGENSRGQ